jgi:ketosteroid isomerase-like protein
MKPDALARGLVDALSGPDLDRLRALVSPEARCWVNIGPVELSAEERFAVLAVERSHLNDLRFDDVRVRVTDVGFVVQLTTVAVLRDGGRLRIPVCLVATTDRGRITRLEEYADSGPAAPLLARLRHDRADSGAVNP